MARRRVRSPGAAGPTGADVARLAGVSRATVSRVLNEHPHVRPAVRRAVLRATRRLRYRPDEIARSLIQRRTGTIGLLLADIGSPFYAGTAKVIVATLRARGYAVILCESDNLRGMQQEHVDILRRRRVDGIIFGSVFCEDPEVEELVVSGFPCIMYNRRLASGRGNFVAGDNVRAGEESTRHLIGLGHARIGLISGPSEISTARERLAGYRLALDAAGLPFDPAVVCEVPYQPDAALRAAEELLKRTRPPTAVIAGNDLMALSVIQAAAERGLQVPGDLAVVGMDDIPIAAHPSIQLTTVSQHSREMAELAAKWMLEIIDDPRRGDRHPFQHLIRPTLVVRQTCGGARSGRATLMMAPADGRQGEPWPGRL
jgi:LacI family transcriptional regulator